MRRFLAITAVALSLGCTTARVAPPSKALPPLPTSIETPMGRVTIVRVPNLHWDSLAVAGLWRWDTKTIAIEHYLATDAAWLVLFHEECHVAFTSSGLAYLVRETLQDAICDAMASQRMRERFPAR